jgi:hypothetical protein
MNKSVKYDLENPFHGFGNRIEYACDFGASIYYCKSFCFYDFGVPQEHDLEEPKIVTISDGESIVKNGKHK